MAQGRKLRKMIDENGVLIIPEGTTHIKSFLFERCMKLKKIVFSKNVVSVGSHAFWCCSNLEEVIFCEGMKKIDNDAFQDCTKLKSIRIPSSVDCIGRNPFWGCEKLKSIQVDKNNPVYDSRDNCNAIIRTKIHKLVSGCSNTKIPESVRVIGYGAFACSGLKKIGFPSSVRKIKESAFSGCENLKAVYFPKGIISIDDSSIQFCSNLDSIKISPLNKKYDCRNDCNAIIETKTDKLIIGCNSTTIPNTVSSIGCNAFIGLNIKSIVIPNNIREIEHDAFAYCEKLESIKLPDSLKRINSDLLMDCSRLEDIEIPESVERIDQAAFRFCDSLKEIYIPYKVNSIATALMFYANDIESIKVDPRNKTYDSRKDCNAIIETSSNTLLVGCRTTIIPDDVEVIGMGSFGRCKDLKRISLPPSVKKITEDAFVDCKNLEEVDIRNENIIIEENAFVGCAKLKAINICGKKIKFDKIHFHHE